MPDNMTGFGDDYFRKSQFHGIWRTWEAEYCFSFNHTCYSPGKDYRRSYIFKAFVPEKFPETRDFFLKKWGYGLDCNVFWRKPCTPTCNYNICGTVQGGKNCICN